MKGLKLLSLILVMLVSFSGIANVALAGSPSDVQFIGLKVDGNDVSSGETVYVERGDDVDVSVNLKAYSVDDVEDLKIKAWLGGYEDEVEDITGLFDLTPNVARAFGLSLQLPSDMDASKAYNLHVEVYNSDGEKQYTEDLGLVKFQIEETRHDLEVQDVIYSSSVNAGSILYTKVRVENTGAKDEKDVKVSVSIPELGVSARDYIDELVYEENNDDDSTTESIGIALRLPDNAVTGDYELQIDVEYNRERELTSVTRMVHVNGIAAGAKDMVISIDTTTQEVAKGDEVAYKLMFANLGTGSAVYSVEVAGEEAWADAKVNPGFVTLAPGQAGEVIVSLEAKDDAAIGSHMFSLRVKAGEATVEDLTLNADVVKASSLGSLKTGLEIGFAIAVILLIILGLVVAFYKIGGKKTGKPSEPEGLTEETYY